MNNLSLYIHIPFCKTKCRYCGFYSRKPENHDVKALIDCFIFELQNNVTCQTVETIYIGGGSPSCLPSEELLRLVKQITSSCFNATEITVEVNPEQMDEKTFVQLKKLGVNRISIGAQSFEPSILKFLKREHTVSDIEITVEKARRAGFLNISLDLIFAIPTLTPAMWQSSLQSALKLKPEHISAYALSYEQNTPLQKDFESGCIIKIDEETDRQMYELAIDEFASAGLKQYEISNFAKPGSECRHNLTYWSNRPYVGIGPSAASYYHGKRTANIADIDKYIEVIKTGRSPIAETEMPGPLETACHTAVLNLRRTTGINLEEFKHQTGFDALNLFAEPISQYKRQNLIGQSTSSIFLTREAFAIADSILCDFTNV